LREGCFLDSPPEDILEIYVDVAYNIDQGDWSMGVIAKDSDGKFIVANCMFIDDPFMAEAYALRKD
jgi:hypothetical protein